MAETQWKQTCVIKIEKSKVNKGWKVKEDEKLKVLKIKTNEDKKRMKNEKSRKKIEEIE